MRVEHYESSRSVGCRPVIDYLDLAFQPGRPCQSLVRGNQHDIQRLGQGDVRGIVGQVCDGRGGSPSWHESGGNLAAVPSIGFLCAPTIGAIVTKRHRQYTRINDYHVVPERIPRPS